MIRIATIGAGHWGPNLIRNFHNKQRSVVDWIVDLDAARLETALARFPDAKGASDASKAIADPDVDAVVVATPTVTHYDIVKSALEAGKHVLVEKPLCDIPEKGAELVELAEKAGKVLLVGHVFVYNPAVQWVKRRIDAGELGEIFYISSSRTNLGPIRMDVNASWDLAAQDLAIFDYWLDDTPVSVSAVGGNWINPGIQDAVFATVRYAKGLLAHVHVSWVNPRKARFITVVADKNMLTYDDMNMSEPLRVYDKKVTDHAIRPAFVDSFASFRASIQEGDITIPRVPMGEPLRNECEHFLDCVEENKTPMFTAKQALAVVKTLSAIDRSMAAGGNEMEI